MPHDPDLADRMRSAFAGRADIAERRMFGGIVWMLNGNMLCGVEVGRYMFRVGAAQVPEALQRKGASAMEMAGRPMGGFVWVNAKGLGAKGLQDWIAFASRFVGALPPK